MPKQSRCEGRCDRSQALVWAVPGVALPEVTTFVLGMALMFYARGVPAGAYFLLIRKPEHFVSRPQQEAEVSALAGPPR